MTEKMLRDELDRLRADAAVMRTTLENVQANIENWPETGGVGERVLPTVFYDCLDGRYSGLEGSIKAALATNAGRPLLDKIAAAPLEVAKSLRFNECQHGIKQHWHDNQLVTPLCDACVMSAVRAALADGGKPGPV